MRTQLVSRFGRKANVIRSEHPLSDDQIRQVAPSIFAEEKHESRSTRYTYIPTIDVLKGLRQQGFLPFFAAQSKVRNESKREHTKHMLRLRHQSQIAGQEANEIILLNSHDGSSSYQMLAGMFRFVCTNGLVCGDVQSDIRVPHKGDVVDRVIEGAFDVLEGFGRVVDERDEMKSLTLNDGEQAAFAKAALALKFDEEVEPPPVTERQLLQPRRLADTSSDMWTTFNRIQENLIVGGLPGRNARGRTMRTRPVVGIDNGVKLNRALWVLADALRKLKS